LIPVFSRGQREIMFVPIFLFPLVLFPFGIQYDDMTPILFPFGPIFCSDVPMHVYLFDLEE